MDRESLNERTWDDSKWQVILASQWLSKFGILEEELYSDLIFYGVMRIIRHNMRNSAFFLCVFHRNVPLARKISIEDYRYLLSTIPINLESLESVESLNLFCCNL